MSWNFNDNIIWFIIATGAIMGSLKANLNDKREQSSCNQLINFLAGTFCGMSVAGHYTHNISLWLSGVLSLLVASLSISILDALYELTPRITKKLVNWWLDTFTK